MTTLSSLYSRQRTPDYPPGDCPTQKESPAFPPPLCFVVSVSHGYEKKVVQSPGKPATTHTRQKKVYYSPELAVSPAPLTNPLVLFVLTDFVFRIKWYYSEKLVFLWCCYWY